MTHINCEVKFIKKNWANLLLICLFAVGTIFAVVAMTQTLTPLNSIIKSGRRIADTMSSPSSRQSALEIIKPFIKIRSAYLMIYSCTVVFFAYLFIERALLLLNKKMPVIILPLIASANIILLLIAASAITDFNIGLGLIPPAENLADNYSWYTAPYISNNSHITYFTPTFWTVVFPLIFLGFLPLIWGLKHVFASKQLPKG